MKTEWTKEKLQTYIDEQIEENKHLDYKASDSLDKSPSKKKEITKDVSSFANSDGGIIIYGISEYNEKDKKHLPEKITPIYRTEYSKECLEHVIGSIIPKIEDLRIFSVTINENDNTCVYIVDIPKSNTAHQAQDKRYYMRGEFESIPMDDWQVKDVINRGNKPILDIELYILNNSLLSRAFSASKYEIQILVSNKGNLGAQQIECYLELEPEFKKFIKFNTVSAKNIIESNRFQMCLTNQVKNEITINNVASTISMSYRPLLPGVKMGLGTIPIYQKLIDSEATVYCTITSEYGNFNKTFKIKDLRVKKI